jgi:hypothetical protein
MLALTKKKMKHPSPIRINESGNALWFILLAITLMAALTLMLSRGGSSSEQTADFERIKIAVTKLLRYAKSMEETVRRMQMINGCSENELSFFQPDHPMFDYPPHYENASAPADGRCNVFGPNGGGLSILRAPMALDPVVTVHIPEGNNTPKVAKSRVIGVGTSAPDLVLDFHFKNADACAAINRIMHGFSSFPTINSRYKLTHSNFKGDFTSYHSQHNTGMGALEAKHGGCFFNDTNYYDGGGEEDYSDRYSFYYVLIAR